MTIPSRADSVLALMMLVITAFDSPAARANAPFYWEYVNVDIEVEDNGDMWVIEEHKYVFTAAHTNERYRWISLDSIDSIEEVSVTENGAPLSAMTGIENNQFWIRWRHQLDPPEHHTFTLSYRVKGGLRTGWFSDAAYWKAIFAERSAPIEAAEVLIRWPVPLEDPSENFSLTSVGIAEVERVDSRSVRFILIDSLPPGKGMIIRIRAPNAHLETSLPIGGIVIVGLFVVAVGFFIQRALSRKSRNDY